MTWAIPCLVILLSALSGCAQNGAESNRPASWARPIQLQGVPNLYRVTDYLFRSEQPTAEGMQNLERMGIKTIIDLKVTASDMDEIWGTDLSLEEVNVKPWHIEDEDVVRVLRVIRKRENGPFLMHCWKGSDRVGAMIAMFRIIEQGWTKEEAIREMVEGGYRFHREWINIVRYVKEVDIERIRKKLEN